VPGHGEAWITTLDVGQGLAVLVRTAQRTLLYDAGPAYGGVADSGARIVVPVLRAAGIERLDALVISHDDTDHHGGAQSVLESLEADALISSLPRAHALNALARTSGRCSAGMQWDWDGVRFRFLHPEGDRAPRRKNDASCVLSIAAAGGTMLLTGDIEADAEATLLSRQGESLKSDVLLAPHHGARRSTGRELLAAAAPRWVVVSAGRNRFGHPAPETLSRIADAGATALRTDQEGAVLVRLQGSGVQAVTQAALRPRYWRTSAGI
jgi:competence protein ComEC